jgi:hypothetical protein
MIALAAHPKNLKELGLGKFFRLSRQDGEWILTWRNASTGEVVRVDPNHPVARSQLFDLAVTAYDTLVIDYGVHPQHLDQMIAKIVNQSLPSECHSEVIGWLGTCWLLARAKELAFQNKDAAEQSRKRYSIEEAFRLIYGEMWLCLRDAMQSMGRSGRMKVDVTPSQ